TADISQHPITTSDESPSEQQQHGKAKASVPEPHETSIAAVSDDELADWEEKQVEIAVRESLAVATNENPQVERAPQPSTSTAIDSSQQDVIPPSLARLAAMPARHQLHRQPLAPPETQDQAEGRRRFGHTSTVRPGITIIGRSYTNVSPSHITINGTAYFEIATVTDPITKHPSKQVMYLTAEDQGDKRIEMGKTYRINIERTAGNRGVRAVIAEVKEEKLSTPSKSKGKPKR
ncbi:MAG TPA: hypothetical protein VM532_11770, partial [Burkholderiales bacterium]|nr:hypothetical protein [Burkholderiales bacterium]